LSEIRNLTSGQKAEGSRQETTSRPGQIIGQPASAPIRDNESDEIFHQADGPA